MHEFDYYAEHRARGATREARLLLPPFAAFAKSISDSEHLGWLVGTGWDRTKSDLLDTDLTSEQRENLGLVRLSAESVLSIINDNLDFSKIEAGKFEIEAIPFDLRESLGETMKSLGVRAHQKGLELVYDVQPGVPEALLGDPGRIRQVLVNLVGNAIKFTEKGEVFIDVEEESQGEAVTCLHFKVKDSGVGIPEAPCLPHPPLSSFVAQKRARTVEAPSPQSKVGGACQVLLSVGSTADEL